MSSRILWGNFVPSTSSDQYTDFNSEKNPQLPPTNPSTGTAIKEFYDSIVSLPPQSSPKKIQPAKIQRKPFKEPLVIPSARQFLRSATKGDLKTLKIFINNGGDVNVRDEFGWTALMCSSASGHQTCVEYLLSVNADKFVRDKSYSSARTVAKKYGHKEILKLLMNSGKAEVKAKKKVEEEEKKLVEGGKKVFFCQSCNDNFNVEESLHLKSTGHLLSQKFNSSNFPYHLGENNVGFQLMVKSGWDKEKGLGPDGSGRKIPIKTVLKRNRKGFGLEKGKKARITHFAAGNAESVKDLREKEERPPNRKMIERQKLVDKWKEIKFRRMFSDF